MNVLGVGIDIVECLRIAHMIEKHGEMFLGRVFTPQEIEYCSARKQATQHYSGRWAAKEAVMKALGTGWRRGIGWQDLEILNNDWGRPSVRLRGGVRDLIRERGIAEIQISISHCRMYATAFAVALGKDIASAP